MFYKNFVEVVNITQMERTLREKFDDFVVGAPIRLATLHEIRYFISQLEYECASTRSITNDNAENILHFRMYERHVEDELLKTYIEADKNRTLSLREIENVKEISPSRFVKLFPWYNGGY